MRHKTRPNNKAMRDRLRRMKEIEQRNNDHEREWKEASLNDQDGMGDGELAYSEEERSEVDRDT